MKNKLITGMKNAGLKQMKKMKQLMMLSAFFLTVGAGMMHAATAYSSPETAEPQQSKIRITGTVVDVNGEPVIGANIMEKGTANGNITDTDGNFYLTVQDNAILQISYIGYISQAITVGNQTHIKITLLEDNMALDEIVVIGYGTTKRKDFTGSVTSLKLEDSPIALTVNQNALESLKGNVTGLDIGATNSAGGQPSMLIRGQKSISGSNDPLVVVDGVIFMGSINDLNPNDIATYDVLKDATSAAVYGSRSANGVIMITTKKGRAGGKPVIRFNASNGMQSWHLRPTLMNGAQWMDAVGKRNHYSDYSFLTAQQKENYDAGRETDWLDEATRTGWIQDYQASVSGAGEKMNYYLSASWSDNKAVIRGDDYSRLSVLSKISTDITDWLQTGVDISFSKSDYSGFAADLGFAAILQSPYSMKYRDEANGLLEKYPNGNNAIGNPQWGIYDEEKRENMDVRDNFRANVYAEVKAPFLPGLSYRFNYSGTLEQRRSGNFYHESDFVPIGPYNDPTRYSAETRKNYLTSANGNYATERTTGYVMDHILKYNRTFGKHTVDVTAVATRDSREYKYKNTAASDFLENGNTLLGFDGLHYAKIQKISYSGEQRANIGYLGRINYSFADRYYLTGAYRRDGASVFGNERKWGNFASVGAAWRISGEHFLAGIAVLNDLKLKLSWGKNGNQGLSPYSTLSRVVNGASGGIFYVFDNSGKPSYGINQTTMGNISLGWETTQSWNAGFESAWLDSRLFMNLDVYFSRTTDQIFTRNIPVMTGFRSMYSSMGEVSNRGVELTLRSVNVKTKDLNWTTGVTFWMNRNKLIHLYGEDLDGDGKEDDDIGNGLFIGQSIHSIFGYTQDGIVQTDDTEYINTYKATPGDAKYKDINSDGALNADDRSIIGRTDPNFKLNMSNTLAYKNWELYVMLAGTFGGNNYYLKDNRYAFLAGGDPGTFGGNSIYIPYWTEENRSNTYPSPTFAGNDGRFLGLQNRAYVRLQDITLSYTFREPWIKKANIGHLKVFATGKNLATITGWTAGDPEIGSTILSGSYPVAATLSLGINLGF
ncbi:MAG: TonB-dependent receptor [Tannerella sp.]|jgi:TonB-linked SusC/RagA family outer membrane protein|nr:TonB-dependent receptor [Tannerella sp.]